MPQLWKMNASLARSPADARIKMVLLIVWFCILMLLLLLPIWLKKTYHF